MPKLKVKDILRYSRPYNHEPEKIEGYYNHFFLTHYPGKSKVLLERGINQIAKVGFGSEERIPAILIRSSPHKIGSDDTPWQDIFDVDNGHIRFYGDNKEPGKDPALSPGNRILLTAFSSYNGEDRSSAVPLIFYKGVRQNNLAKGFIEFNGFGIITAVQLITQYDRRNDRTFSNYAFNFTVFSIAKEQEEFDWEWINDRRNENLSLKDTLRFAPQSWIDWVKNGNKVLERNRRRVSKLLTSKVHEQTPAYGSKELQILKDIYEHYQSKKALFEGLASAVTAKILRGQLGHYVEGWITPPTSDGGADFYGRIDVGQGFGKAKLLVLGQAKCEKLNQPTGGNHVARTVARLRRGWLGVYVTTSYFSEAVQREIIEDEYPILLVNGKKLAETVIQILHEDGYRNLDVYLQELDIRYKELIQARKPDELLLE
ncbi:MAG TPA: restriction endonuclease [Chitinophagaceae bacterium]|nr:restriction endonuclease [Chitinophagaceae bacterium]